ncbi:M20/M25/M40 family metallo-hydrolase [Pseudalkalibacillus decolorationis]|uniref:M20/M25/M40 family metallo-hydrolase n=1 Tax=Pseudalkalibacillus decolorationis TaxID=163879 RepID=UPI0021496D25|nr:M20/M25/M40 family metallo-hydrolase [Pseudalkalibacillus decolorationis]
MNEQSHEFLQELLTTPSPSGFEMGIQRKWINYVEKFADKVETDYAGNAIGIVNPEAPFKILIAGHCDEIGFMINRIDENGYIHFTKLGGISHKPAIGMKVEILGYKKTVTGVIGVNAEHHGGINDKFDFEDLYIDCGAKSKEEVEQYVQIGDLAIYKRGVEFLMNNRISGRGLDNRTGAFIVAEVLRNAAEKNPNIGVYAVSTVNEETNMGGAYFAAANIKPDFALAIDVTFATDYPGVNRNKHGDIKLDNGPVLAKGAPIHYKINNLLEESARKHQINLQYELTPRVTGTDADKMRLTGVGVPIALVSLPLRYMHSPVETASLKDINDEITLISEMIHSLQGDENLKPLE